MMIKKYLLIIFLLASCGLSFSQIKIVYASHKYVMGNRDTKSAARRICFLEAKRMCLEKVGTYIESNTEVINYKLSKDQITAYSAAIVQTEIIKDTIQFINGTMIISMSVKALIDMQKFNEMVSNIRKDRSLEEKILNQQIKISQLEERMNNLQNKLSSEKKMPPSEVVDINGIQCVFIKRGTFQMGDTFGESSLDSWPVHNVTVYDFYLGETEVTVGQFRAFVNSTGYRTDAEKNGWSLSWNGSSWGEKQNHVIENAYGVNWMNSGLQQNDNHPVIHVSWNDAKAFCD